MIEVRDFKKNEIPLVRGFLPQTEFLDIEIGCGVGWHSIEYSKFHSNRFLIAIEKTSNKFEKFLRRKENHPELENLIAVQSNAINWISSNVQPAQVDRYFILYPNPSPKDPQKRWFRMPFMRYMIETLKPNGTITLATNMTDYYDEAKKYNREVWGLKVVEDRIILGTEKPRTHFEKKYLATGQTCYNLVVQKALN